MDRRNFLKLLTSGATGLVLDPEKLLWIPGKRKFFLPSEKQVEFFNRTAEMKLYGIPYHESNASSDQWLGFIRKEACEEIRNLVNLIEEDKKRMRV